MMGLQVAASKRKYEIGACTDLNDIQPNCTPAKNPRIDDSHITTTSTSSSTSESTSTSVTLVDVTFVHRMQADDDRSGSISNKTTLNGELAETPSLSSLTHIETSSVNNETTSSSLTSRENETLTTQTSVTDETRAKSTNQAQEVPQLTGRGHELTLAKLNTVSIASSNPAGNWNNNGTDDDETVIDPISKLQAVAVPDEAWGGGAESTRSTLATTLLPPDDLDEDIDDFEDDFDDDDVMLPSYGPPPVAYRYVPSNKEYTPPPPFPKFPSEQYHNQNCSRTPTAAAYNRYGTWNNIQYYHNEPMPISDPPQTIRCAENGKSYTELGTYTFFNSNTTRHIKRCCDGKNNWCNNKQCYKEKRIRMMNLSMFKLSRFRQASDQSLYRSVLICNTLKAIEKEIDTEKRQVHQIRRQLSQIGRGNNIMLGNGLRNAPVTPQKPPQQQPTSDYASGPHSIISSSNDSSSNVSYRGVNGVIDPVSDIATNHNNEQQKRSEYSENNPNSSNTSSNNLLNNGSNYLQSYTNHNRIYGGNLTGFESIPPPPQPYEYHPLKDPQSGRATPFPASGGYPDTDSGYGGEEGDLSPDGQFRSINWGSVLSLSSQSALDPLNNNELFSSHTSPYITSNSCGSSFNTASSLSSSTTTTNYLDMDLGYDVLPNCYKLTSFGSDDFLKTPLMEPGKVVYDGHDNNMPDTFSTHIMVGS